MHADRPASHAQHSVKQTGVQASHPFWKLPYWNETLVRHAIQCYSMQACVTHQILVYIFALKLTCKLCKQVRGPDPMHTVSGEVKSIFTMLSGKASPLSPSNPGSSNVYKYEVEENKRWEAMAPAVAAAGASSSRGRGENSVSIAVFPSGIAAFFHPHLPHICPSNSDSC